MAFIGKLRDRMGTWVVVFVFVAISAFILGDLLGNNSVLLNSNDVGEIGGHTVSLEEFQQAVQEREANYILNFNRQPGDREMTTLRQQAWEMLILRHAIQPEYGKLGVAVTDEEVVDMITGKNVDAGIRQSFTNPQTGEFDRAQLGTYINQIKAMPEGSEPRVRWEIFQRDMRPGRERIKYEQLLLKSAYITTAEAEMDYHLQNDVAEVKYLYVPYFAVSDTAITFSDADLRAFYTKNREKYKSEQQRDIKYVTFPVVASADDSAAIREELLRLVEDFKTSADDSTFASLNSDNTNAYSKYTVSSLPSFVKSEDLVQGNVVGPFLDGSAYRLFKVSKVGTDTIFNARASHILIRWDDDSEASKKTAKEKARNILKEIKAGADFAAKAREFGTDGTAPNGGDLGWFATGAMVKPFETAVFSATKKGVLNDVVETEFGFHIIEVTELKDNKAFTVAVIEREITPGDASINEALRKAENFATDLSGIENFTARAEELGFTVLDAKNLGTNERRVGNLGDARQIVQWLFRDTEKGNVSEVFDLQDTYAVAVMTGEQEKGYRSFDAVKDEITPAVRNEVKGKEIIQKLSALTGSLDEMAAAFGKDAAVYANSSLKLNSNTLTSVGFDPQAVGKAFSLESGKRSAPYAGETGVIIFEMQNKTVAPAVGDYTMFKTQLEQTASNRNSFTIAEALKESAKIEDLRYKFY
jgi:peptidyl-prolyl cis-trans isomerase D